MLDDAGWMRLALEQAAIAARYNEVPVGAVLIRHGELIAAGYNQSLRLCRPSAHAEMLVLDEAARILHNYRIEGTTLYVTIEPCLMCLGAMLHARIDRLVFGAYEPKTGAVCSRHDLLDNPKSGVRLDWFGGVLADEAGALMHDFFMCRR